MLPTKETAEKELQIAGELNPGPWTKHSINVGIAARNIAERVPGMDAEKAYIVGVLHDIGRRVGIVDIPTHVYEGYKYCMDKGWDEVARICMTHSYPLMQEEFTYELKTEAEHEIKKYIEGCQADEYDMLIQLCDALATDYGFVIVEKRFVDVTRRYGIMEIYIKGWERTFATKEYFEEKMGCSVYDVLPDIGRTTLLSPKPWKPENRGGSMLAKNKSGWTLLDHLNIKEEEIGNYENVTGAFAIVKVDGQFLIGYNKWRQQWEFCGGGIEPGETAREAAMRELFEETHQKASELTFRGISRMQKPDGTLCYQAVFVGKIDRLEPFVTTDEDEMSDIMLWDLKQDVGYVDECDLKIVEMVCER